MPIPKPGEKKGAYIRRCVPIVIHEGTAKGPRQALAVCYHLWASHDHTEHPTVNAKTPNPLRMDPTRTTMLRKRFMAEMVRRFKIVKRNLVKLIGDEDAFGLRQSRSILANTRWSSRSTPEQMDLLRAWLEEQVDTTVLGSKTDNWLEQYIQESYERGQGRAFDDAMKKYKYGEGEYFQGSRDQFLRDSFRRPASVERVKVMATRAWSDLKGVTESMNVQMQRTLTDSFIQGDGAMVMARKLANDVDKIGINRAKTIARTETVRAHAEGQLDALENLGATEVGVMVEWSTAGDSMVCPLCGDINGIVLKITEARGMLPRHPNCRCAWIPANVGEDGKDQIRGKGPIQSAMLKSMVSEVTRSGRLIKGAGRRYKDPETGRYTKTKPPSKAASEARDKSRWQGAETEISAERPSSDVPFKEVAEKVKEKIELGPVVPEPPAGITGKAAVTPKKGPQVTLGPAVPEPPAGITGRGTTVSKPKPKPKRKPTTAENLEALDKNQHRVYFTDYPEEKISKAVMRKVSGEVRTAMDEIAAAIPNRRARMSMSFDVKKGQSFLSSSGNMAYGNYTSNISHMNVASGLRTGGSARPRFRQWNVGSDMRTVVRHEYGHHYWYEALQSQERIEWGRVTRSFIGSKKDPVVSQYARTNAKELWAESFAAYTHPSYQRGSLPSVIEKFLDHVTQRPFTELDDLQKALL